MKILWITNEIPYPPINGSSIRVYNLLKRIALEHEIYLFTLKTADDSLDRLDILKEVCRDVGFTIVPYSRFWSKPVEFFWYLLRGIPPDLRFYLSARQRQDFLHFIDGKKFDIIQIEDSFMALWLDLLPENLNVKSVLDFQDVGFRKYDRIYRLEKKITRRLRIWLHSRILSRWEATFAERFDLCIAMSDIDKAVLLTANPKLHVETLPSGIDLDDYQVLPISNPIPTILFVGNMDYLPNVDAVILFVEQILPKIRQDIPNVEFYIVGIDPRPVVCDLAGDGIYVTGRVPDIKPYYERSWVSVVPLRAGTGIRTKIIEAMALGRPTISTTIGCEGLFVTHGVDIMVSDDPQEFSEYVIQMLKDEELRSRIILNGRKNVETNYNWDALADRAVSFYRSLIS